VSNGNGQILFRYYGNVLSMSQAGATSDGWLSKVDWNRFNGAAVGAAPVNSVFGRLGAVVAAAGDYTFAQIGSKPTTLAGYGITDPVVLTSGSYADPAWITSLAYSKITGTPASLNFTNSVRRTLATAGPSTDSVDLVGDAATPGNSQYYGTNNTGVKGFFSLPVSDVVNQWLFSTNVTMADPGSGKFRTNQILFSTSTLNFEPAFHMVVIDNYNFMRTLQQGDTLLMQDKSNANNWIRYNLLADPVDNTGWFQISIVMVDGGGTAPTNNSPVLVTFTQTGTSSGGAGAVASVFGRTGAVVALVGDYAAFYEPTLGNPSTNGYILSSTTAGVRSWIAPASGGGAVSSVFTRTGAVVAATNDYTFAQIGSKPTTLSGYGITDAQPLDSDLTAIAALTTDPFGRGLLPLTTAGAVRTYIGAGTSSFDGTFTSLTGKPTTLVGYGITDAQPLDSDLTAIAALATTAFGRAFLTQPDPATSRSYIGAGTSNFDGTWTSLTGKPTTIAGYGITDAYTKTQSDANYAAIAHTHTFASLTSKPTTLVGYGITDAQPLDADLTSIAALTTTSFGRSFLTQADAASSRTYIGAGTSNFDGTFTSLTGKPTTISGYGITDAQPLDADLTAIAALTTTSFGRGTLTQADAAATRTYIGAGTSSFDGTFTSLTGKPTTISGYGITDAYTKAQSDTNYAPAAHTHTFASLTSKPTTLVGYGITDAQPLDSDLTTLAGLASTTDNFIVGVASVWASRTPAQVRTSLNTDGLYAPISHTQAWSTITGTPTTTSGYGITDVYTTTTSDGKYQPLDTQLTSIAGLAYGTNALKVVRVNATETGFELVTPASGGGSSTFIGLTDVPASYTGSGGRVVAVNSGATALEFVAAPAAGAGGSTTQVQYNNTGTLSGATNAYIDSADGMLTCTGVGISGYWSQLKSFLLELVGLGDLYGVLTECKDWFFGLVQGLAGTTSGLSISLLLSSMFLPSARVQGMSLYWGANSDGLQPTLAEQ
jgi:hypothetical protein